MVLATKFPKENSRLKYEKGLKGEDFVSGPLALEHTSYDINTSEITDFEDENYFYYLTKSDSYRISLLFSKAIEAAINNISLISALLIF